MRFGYACISVGVKECSTAGTVTLASLKKLGDDEARASRLKEVAKRNLINTLRLLWYNKGYDIDLYRFSSQLIPLASHEVSKIWDFRRDREIRARFAEIGEVVRESGFLVSSHPGEYTVLTSSNEMKTAAAIKDLEYHADMMSAMGLDYKAKMVLHIGGAYNDKAAAVGRFIRNYRALREDIKRRLILENDDTTYSAAEVLEICKRIGAPMVFDVHHHKCLNNSEDIRDLLPEIFSTWHDRTPKIHFSSPRDPKNFRSHADYIDAEEFKGFLEAAKGYEFDVMIEAKKKDLALLRLREALRGTQ